MKTALILSALMLTSLAHAQIVVDGDCTGGDFMGIDHKTKIHYFGFCDEMGVTILDPRTKTYFVGYCDDGTLRATNLKIKQKMTGTCTRNSF